MKELFTWDSTLDQGVYDYVAKYGRSPQFGARPMERLVENVIGTGIADFQISKNTIADESKLHFSKLQPTHDFSLKVNNSTSNTYTVDPQINSLTPVCNMPTKLQAFFESIRDYND